MELLNQSNVTIIKRYLGLGQEELLETYDYLSFLNIFLILDGFFQNFH